MNIQFLGSKRLQKSTTIEPYNKQDAQSRNGGRDFSAVAGKGVLKFKSAVTC
jgi:hypothetical protein